MACAFEHLARIVDQALSDDERAGAVAYVSLRNVAAGSAVPGAPAGTIAPWNACVAFIDRQPAANWGHASRFLLIDPDSGVVVSVEARFPPFARSAAADWRIAYRAKGVADADLLVPV